ncbi:MAG: hypothetical protein WB791_05725 [Waddliaceae bacterium]
MSIKPYKLINHLFFFLFFLLPFSTSLGGEEEQVVGTLNGVDLIFADLFNKDGHNFGEQYFVLNRNDQPMRVSIRLVGSENAVDHLVKYTIIVNRRDRVEIGKVIQDNLSEGANWKYEWQVETDRLAAG